MSDVTAAGAANTQPVRTQENVEAANAGCLCGMNFSGLSLNRIVPAPLKHAASFIANKFSEMTSFLGRRNTTERQVVFEIEWPTSDHVTFGPNEGYRLKNSDQLPNEFETFHLGSYGGKMLCHFQYDNLHAFEMCNDAELLRSLIEFKDNGGAFETRYVQNELAKIEDGVLYVNPRFCGPLNDPKTALRDAMREVLGLPKFGAPETDVVKAPISDTQPKHVTQGGGTTEMPTDAAVARPKTEVAATPVEMVTAGPAHSNTKLERTVVTTEQDLSITTPNVEDVTVSNEESQGKTGGQDKKSLSEGESFLATETAAESSALPETEAETDTTADALATAAPITEETTTKAVTDSVAPGRGIGKEAFKEMRDVFQNGAPPKQNRGSN